MVGWLRKHKLEKDVQWGAHSLIWSTIPAFTWSVRGKPWKTWQDSQWLSWDSTWAPLNTGQKHYCLRKLRKQQRMMMMMTYCFIIQIILLMTHNYHYTDQGQNFRTQDFIIKFHEVPFTRKSDHTLLLYVCHNNTRLWTSQLWCHVVL